jgi:hypothetical protein
VHEDLPVLRREHAEPIGSVSAIEEMRLIDVAHDLGVSKQRVSRLASEKGFPRARHHANGTRGLAS